MARSPVRRELQPLRKSTRRRSEATWATWAAWRRLVATLSDPDLIMVTAFCVIGLLVMLNLALRVADFGALAVQLEQFP
jgi:hypothetical protein